MKPEYLKLLSDKNWRLNNLYWITDKEGKPTRFRMTPEQREYFEGIHTRNIILKSRQLGFTTEVCIIQLDAALFESAKCALIAHTLNGAKRLFREKVKYAYDKLPAEIKAANPASNDTSGELVFKKGGSLYVSTSFRGGTLRYLHVSEFGKICAKYPDKAREIVTGAFEAVSTGCFATIESTAEGRAGDFFDYCQTAEKALLQGKALSALDWNFFFFSWWKNPQYAIDPVESLPVRLLEYFAEMEAKHGVVVNERQKAWYYAKEKTLGDDMKREYPTIPAEAFQQSVEGAYYAKQFRWLYTNKRIGQIPDSGKWLSVGDATARQWVENNYIASRFERFGYFSQGSTLTSNTQALVDSTGLYWIKTGEIPTSGYVVPPGTNPDYPDFMCVGYLTDYDWMSVLNWGADNTYSISDNVGEDSVDSFNLAGYHAEKRAALFNTIQTVRIPTGTYLLDKTTLGKVRISRSFLPKLTR
ncbi:terminase [Citrobacter portucalensis]|uniref:terminase n=1 Tax=Citrobacter portucalensis TaxID=1639133 RepID=UPI0039848CA9